MKRTFNELTNLYLCENRKEHMRCHHSMEKCGFRLLNNLIWFNPKKGVYSIIRCAKYKPSRKVDCLFTNVYIRTYKKKFSEISYEYSTNDRAVHCIIVERILGRSLFSNEVVHHIDGDSLNNNPNNLFVMTRSNHNLCHCSLQSSVAELYVRKLVKFENGIYLKKGE